ncbi:ATP-dependent endonuclease [Chitinophaga sancti]|uniref:AAA family ATPase n=1 Tax=Chitinophaga sancti TaxID=1004 RepID=A0A1K1SSQ4_9BACT|nr:AAA family ATPase [Chitinophaga sancti]WQD65416.1 AAA family ATPase [Chitinophaga sancti]WQG88961.1 AAA family ATPase [Chitinophaga sancti]SFW87345.1 Predicted ATP-dependent endonuclease of the OLD family, contains P-loop ATPase and TOPRIM domains [Chitinophaga sancti]
MKIDFVHILNFRKLKSCRIDLTNKETIFVGANNSGKTSAMDALITFFRSRSLTTRDFTLSNWRDIKKIGENWETETDPNILDLNIVQWAPYLPSLDIWLNVEPAEIHYVSHLIPTLDWSGGPLGVRLRYEPKDVKILYKNYIEEWSNSRALTAKGNGKLKIWPKDIWDYLDRDTVMSSQFTIKAYLLDPSNINGEQQLGPDAQAIEASAFNGLIRIDIINAQRGFSDVNTESGEISSNRNLSTQFRAYYDKHLNPVLKPTETDLNAIESIEATKQLFDKNLRKSFEASLSELEELNIPGFDNPAIVLSSQLRTAEMLNHNSALLFKLDDNHELSLPENYNGLGYQNLISIIFKLIRFRDDWMQVGKVAKQMDLNGNGPGFEPLHLVLIEEPEAHLHAQVQQIFIRKAYDKLRNHANLKEKKDFSTQLVISTHSNHIAHEIDFAALRYFKRQKGKNGEINTSTVVNLSETFGTVDDTTRFAIRYLKTTHCDLFFADAVILVEGPAEKMLVPFFLKKHPCLGACYISILEIGGSHAHRLKPLIEKLGIITLIITDIDTVDPGSNGQKQRTEKGKGFKSGNFTLGRWIPGKQEIDVLLELSPLAKEHPEYPIRVAYQNALTFKEADKDVFIYPYTFEDSLVLENVCLFKKITKASGLLAKMINAANERTINAAAEKMFKEITKENAMKAEFALELLFLQEPERLKIPIYINEGLMWLENKLLANKQGFNLITVEDEHNGK